MKQLIVISGPTGSGESSITKELIKRIPNSERFISTTSRPPRGNEINGVDYNFISKEDFKKKITEGYFLEYTCVKNRDVYYGTPKDQIEEKLSQEKILFFNCDLIGTKALQGKFPEQTLSFFIAPENLDQIKAQLLKRNPDIAPEELEKRLKNAAAEMDDQPFYTYTVVNKYLKLDETVAECYKLILES